MRMLVLFGLLVVIWTCEGAVFVTTATALKAGAASLGPWLSFAAGSLATAVPSSPGYIGTFDYFAALGLTVYGTAPEIAAAIALTVPSLWVPLTVTELLCLLLPPAGNRTADQRTSQCLC